MFTKCTQCKTTFRVTSEQLKLAGGKVRCGNCREVFNALDNLVEELPAAPAEEFAGADDELLSALDQFDEAAPQDELADMLDADEDLGALAGEDNFGGGDEFNEQPASQSQELFDEFAVEAADGSSADDLLGELEQFGEGLEAPRAAANNNTLFNELEEFQEGGAEPVEFGTADARSDIYDIGGDDFVQNHDNLSLDATEMVEPVSRTKRGGEAEMDSRSARQTAREKEKFIRQELRGGSSGVGKAIWSLVIMLLLAVMVLQVMYFKRAELMKYPSLVPALQTMCKVVGALELEQVPCDLPLPRDLEAIGMEEREVRSHPNTPNALLISAKIINKAQFEQPYPLLELSFSDLNQKLIARRTFKPSEYLGKEVDVSTAMPVNVPVRVVLEIVDPGPEAVNFEFNYR